MNTINDVPTDTPLATAQRILSAARAAGDVRREIAALTDIGILLGPQGGAHAAEAFEAASQAALRIGDRKLESDVDGNYGLFLVGTGQGTRGFPMLMHSLTTARALGDRYAEKVALERLGHAAVSINDYGHALDAYTMAVAIAQDLGDVRHEAELRWQSAVLFAESERPDLANPEGENALSLFRQLQHPEVAKLTEALARYQASDGGVLESPFGVFVGSGPAPSSVAELPAGSPGLLRMAFSALKAAAKFVGSGMKVVSDETLRTRLQMCESCEHHTGTRCRVCGCFTSLKAKLPHESCPAHKWMN